MRRILVINHYAGTPSLGMEYRTFFFAREWVRAGHKVLIVAASFSHLRQKNPDIKSVLTFETIEGVDFLWVLTPPYSENGIPRVINMGTFITRLYLSCGKHISMFRPDHVIASSTYTWDNWPAAYYAKRNNARYIYELHDVWPATPMELGGMKPWHPFIWSLQRAENFACRHADRVISLLPAVQEHLVEHGMPMGRFAFVPNGVVLDEWSEIQSIPAGHVEAIRMFRAKRRYLVGYVGGHGLSNALDTLVTAAADARLSDIGIVCVGKGPEKERLSALAKDVGAEVLFLDPVQRRCVPALLELFDVLFMGISGSPLYRFGISPNKLYEYMMAGLPIVHAVHAANDPVREADCGISVPPEDVDALCNGFLELFNMNPEDRRAMGDRGRKFVETHHSVSVLAEKFLNFACSKASGIDVS